MFSDRKRLNVLTTLPACALSPTELLVYSYLAKRDKFGETAKQTEIASATGIHVSTVPKILDRLLEMGLLKDGKPVRKKAWFRSKKAPHANAHWYDQTAFWEYVVPRASELTVYDAFVWSWLRCRFEAIESGKAKSPEQGWSVPYIATCLNMDARTVEASLGRLRPLELAALEGKNIFVEQSLNGITKEFFQSTGERFNTGGSGRLLSFSQLNRTVNTEELPSEEPQKYELQELDEKAKIEDSRRKNRDNLRIDVYGMWFELGGVTLSQSEQQTVFTNIADALDQSDDFSDNNLRSIIQIKLKEHNDAKHGKTVTDNQAL